VNAISSDEGGRAVPAQRPGYALLVGAAPARGPLLARALLAAVLLLVLAGCQRELGGDRPAGPRSHGVPPARWVPYRHVGTVTDLTVARADGWLTAAAYGHLLLLGRDGALMPFARGAGGYATGPGAESYLALARPGPVPGAGCSFAADAVFALQPRNPPGVMEITRDGQAHRFASLPGTVPNGIAFDTIGRFGHRLLVTAAAGGRTSLFGIDCAGRITTISTHLPRMEGGITVAPPSFGAYGGDLVAPDEVTGRLWAIGPSGRPVVVARSGPPTGYDIGVESAGFVPPGFGRAWAAYVADRREPGNPHPGTGNVLRLSAAVLLRAGARPGDLIVASEASARTILVRCTTACTVRRVAAGPASTHTEGHIVFARLG
jgi:hypothetical protein